MRTNLLNASSLSNQQTGTFRNADGTENELKAWESGGRELEKGGKGSLDEKGPKFGEDEHTCALSHKEEAVQLGTCLNENQASDEM